MKRFKKKGFSLIEVISSVTLILLMLSTLLSIISTTSHTIKNQKDLLIAKEKSYILKGHLRKRLIISRLYCINVNTKENSLYFEVYIPHVYKSNESGKFQIEKSSYEIYPHGYEIRLKTRQNTFYNNYIFKGGPPPREITSYLFDLKYTEKGVNVLIDGIKDFKVEDKGPFIKISYLSFYNDASINDYIIIPKDEKI